MISEVNILEIQQKNCKICMDKVLEFLRQCPELSIPGKEHLNVKDFTFTQFISRLEKKLPPGHNTLYKFTSWIGQGMELLDHNNNKGRKQGW